MLELLQTEAGKRRSVEEPETAHPRKELNSPRDSNVQQYRYDKHISLTVMFSSTAIITS